MSVEPRLDLERFRSMLLDQLEARRLAARALATSLDAVRAARSDGTADDEHDPEGSTLSSDWSQLAGLDSDGKLQIAAIDRALARISAGEYGTCLRCGAPIATERLEVRPAAEYCVPCASR